jgi:formylglycine-generating enzyme required for sulfatase activity
MAKASAEVEAQRRESCGSREARSPWAPSATTRRRRPARDVVVDGFWLDEHPVTNLEFLRFVKATGYVTWAEEEPDRADYRRRRGRGPRRFGPEERSAYRDGWLPS